MGQLFTVPKIKRTFFKKDVRYYETEDGKIWDANIYDLKLNPPKQAIKPKADSFAINMSREWKERNPRGVKTRR